MPLQLMQEPHITKGVFAHSYPFVSYLYEQFCQNIDKPVMNEQKLIKLQACVLFMAALIRWPFGVTGRVSAGPTIQCYNDKIFRRTVLNTAW